MAAAVVLLLVTIVSTFGFYRAASGQTDFWGALYMALITISTVGYAEAVPLESAGDRIFVTGKYWPKLFEIKLKDPAAPKPN